MAKPDPAFTPAEGDNIMALTLSLKNGDRITHSFFPSIQTCVRDEEGTTYTMHPSLDLKTPMPAGDIAPGASQLGEISFALPKRLHKFWLYIDPHWGDMAPVVYGFER